MHTCTTGSTTHTKTCIKSTSNTHKHTQVDKVQHLSKLFTYVFSPKISHEQSKILEVDYIFPLRFVEPQNAVNERFHGLQRAIISISTSPAIFMFGYHLRHLHELGSCDTIAKFVIGWFHIASRLTKANNVFESSIERFKFFSVEHSGVLQGFQFRLSSLGLFFSFFGFALGLPSHLSARSASARRGSNNSHSPTHNNTKGATTFLPILWWRRRNKQFEDNCMRRAGETFPR